MDRATIVRIGMYKKVFVFLDQNNAAFAINPAIGLVQVDLNSLLQEINAQGKISTRRLKGYKEEKKEIRSALMTKTQQVGSALFAYWVNNNIKNELNARNYTKRSLFRAPDGNLYMNATQLHGKADPVKAVLAPYSCAAADVDALLANKQQFLAVVEQPKTNRKESGQARRRIGDLLKQGTALLQKLDNFLMIYAIVNSNLFSQYRTARALDKMGGNRKKKKEKPEDAPDA